jgi:uncharacterized protein YegP (UPF0339 family)
MFHLFKQKRRKDRPRQPFHFVLKSRNGKTLMTSENYSRRSGAINGINAAIYLIGFAEIASLAKNTHYWDHTKAGKPVLTKLK